MAHQDEPVVTGVNAGPDSYWRRTLHHDGRIVDQVVHKGVVISEKHGRLRESVVGTEVSLLVDNNVVWDES